MLVKGEFLEVRLHFSGLATKSAWFPRKACHFLPPYLRRVVTTGRKRVRHGSESDSKFTTYREVPGRKEWERQP